MAFISYAQNFEDVILWRALSHIKNGVYIDIGAAHPEEHSVTRAFYESGWSGINVEPLNEYFRELKKGRPRDINLKAAVGRGPALRKLYAFDGTGLSTFDPEIKTRHQNAGYESREVLVPSMTLNQILYDFPQRAIHFLKIDVEGAEQEVIESVDLIRHRPWIVLVEATEPALNVNTRRNWEPLITTQGYRFVYFDGLNCFYVADEHKELEARIAHPPNVFDDFIHYRELLQIREIIILQERVRKLETEVGRPLLRLFHQSREWGDRITGGGVRAMVARLSGRTAWQLAQDRTKRRQESAAMDGFAGKVEFAHRSTAAIPAAEQAEPRREARIDNLQYAKD